MSTKSIQVGEFTVPNGLYIGGKWVQGRGSSLETINPATEESIATIQTATHEDIDLAVRSARECFETSWGTEITGAERGRLMFLLADALEAAKDEIAAIESTDSGKPLGWCKLDGEDAVACLRYYAGMADKALGSVIEVDGKSKYATARKEPIGVVAQIVPWNFPNLMMIWKIAPALAAGCTIVFKAAESTPLTTLKFAELFDKIGFPAGVFNVVSGLGHDVGDYLSRHMDIDKIAFTGSTATGRRIVKAAAESNLKSCTLELGGKSANIVFEQADLEEAAKWAVFGVFENMGQSCTAGSRILVQSSVYDKFCALFVKAAEGIVVGAPENTDTFQGPQVNKAQFEKILGYIESGKKQAKLLAGGSRHGDKGYFIQPTVFGDVTMDMTIAKEEIFGPVASIIKFETEEEAIKIANCTEYGLAAAIHSIDARQIDRVSRKLKAGTVWVNQYTMLSHQVPFGGYKSSGWGRELGAEGMEAYLATKAVHHYYGEAFEWPIKL